MRIFTVIAAAFFLAACASIPHEDRDRYVNIFWDLDPLTKGPVTTTTEMGKVIISWRATATATHQYVSNGSVVHLFTAHTSRSRVYCTATQCFEDRDNNGDLERLWSVKDHRGIRRVIPGKGVKGAITKPKLRWAVIQTISTPKMLKEPIVFSPSDDLDKVVIQQTLGLVFDGMTSASVDDSLTLFKSGIGNFITVWYDADQSPNNIDVNVWKKENTQKFFVLSSAEIGFTIADLGWEYKILEARVDGSLKLEFEAKPVSNFNVSKKMQIDVVKSRSVPKIKTTPDPEDSV